MEKQQVKAKSNIKYRAYYFSLEIIDYLGLFSSGYIYQTLGKQLLRSATSIGANVVEAQAGKTRKDFINFYQIALKSANETKYWLCILEKKPPYRDAEAKTADLLREAIEISKMLGASLLTLKGKKSFEV